MSPLDKARLQKFINTVLRGEWSDILSEETFAELKDWSLTHQDKKAVAVRFAFFEELGDGAYVKHAMHLVCNPLTKGKKITIKDVYLADDANLLALPPDLYEKPLFCIPDSMDELLDNMD